MRLALFALCAISAQAGLFTLSNTTAANVDADSVNRTVTVTGTELGFDSGTMTNVIIRINFAKADGESFDPPFPGGSPFFNEIQFILTSPSATNVTLIGAGSWGAGEGEFDGTIVFDQAAANVVNFAAAPQAGIFRPTGAGSLSDFIGQSALGVWNLEITDTVGLDSLRFRSFDLKITTDAVPEPSSFALIGVGLGGLVWLKRRR